MRESMVARQLAGEEWETLREVRLAALAEAPEAFGSTLAREEAFGEREWRQRAGGGGQFVVTANGSVLGLAGLREFAPGTAEVVSVWVRPDARGRGVADLLVQCALGRAREDGFAEVRLWVAEGNAAAEALYVRQGFRRTGEVQPIGPGRGDEFAMSRPCAGD